MSSDRSWSGATVFSAEQASVISATALLPHSLVDDGEVVEHPDDGDRHTDARSPGVQQPERPSLIFGLREPQSSEISRLDYQMVSCRGDTQQPPE